MQNIILLKDVSFILIVFVWKSKNVIPGFWKTWYYQIVRENIHIAEDGHHKLMNKCFSIWEKRTETLFTDRNFHSLYS